MYILRCVLWRVETQSAINSYCVGLEVPQQSSNSVHCHLNQVCVESILWFHTRHASLSSVSAEERKCGVRGEGWRGNGHLYVEFQWLMSKSRCSSPTAVMITHRPLYWSISSSTHTATPLRAWRLHGSTLTVKQLTSRPCDKWFCYSKCMDLAVWNSLGHEWRLWMVLCSLSREKLCSNPA